MRTPELEARHHAAAMVGRMLLILSRSMLVGYSRGSNIAAVFPELLVVAAIRANDDRRKPPISINRISKLTGLPRANIRRAIAQLIKHGVIEKSGGGHIGVDGYMQPHTGACYFKHMVAAIRATARELDSYG